MAWPINPRPAKALTTLLAEVNEAAPNRSKASDGMLGDPAHASRDSDHNPNSLGVVRAVDITHDPDDDLDCHELAGALVQLFGRHPAMGSGSYVIWNDRIFSYDRRAEGWRTYGGLNPHTTHLHLSVGLAGYDSTEPWDVLDMPLSPADRAALIDELLNTVVNPSAPAEEQVTVRAGVRIAAKQATECNTRTGALQATANGILTAVLDLDVPTLAEIKSLFRRRVLKP